MPVFADYVLPFLRFLFYGMVSTPSLFTMYVLLKIHTSCKLVSHGQSHLTFIANGHIHAFFETWMVCLCSGHGSLWAVAAPGSAARKNCRFACCQTAACDASPFSRRFCTCTADDALIHRDAARRCFVGPADTHTHTNDWCHCCRLSTIGATLQVAAIVQGMKPGHPDELDAGMGIVGTLLPLLGHSFPEYVALVILMQ
jgi:hypothetical protein